MQAELTSYELNSMLLDIELEACKVLYPTAEQERLHTFVRNELQKRGEDPGPPL
jgi:hypothetical protein